MNFKKAQKYDTNNKQFKDLQPGDLFIKGVDEMDKFVIAAYTDNPVYDVNCKLMYDKDNIYLKIKNIVSVDHMALGMPPVNAINLAHNEGVLITNDAVVIPVKVCGVNEDGDLLYEEVK
jgi:hypothetical protein